MTRDARLTPALLAVSKRREARKERADKVTFVIVPCGAEEREREELLGRGARCRVLAEAQRDDVGECARVRVHTPVPSARPVKRRGFVV